MDRNKIHQKKIMKDIEEVEIKIEKKRKEMNVLQDVREKLIKELFSGI